MKACDQIVTHLLATESLAARSRWLAIGALVIWLTASTLALAARDPGHFSRAGTIGTVLVLAAFAVNGAARQACQTHPPKGLTLITRANLRDEKGRPLMLPAAAPRAPDTATRDQDHTLEAIGRLFARLERKSTPARMTEVSAAPVSTPQWACGDLLVNRTLGRGEWTC